MIEFHLPGVTPAPQGSKKAIQSASTGRPIMVESSSAGLKVYRNALVAEARATMQLAACDLMLGAVKVEAIFVFPRPKHHYGTGRNAATIKDSAPELAFPLKRGDIDKLTRALLDALDIANVYADDSQVVSLVADIALVGQSYPADTIVRVSEL